MPYQLEERKDQATTKIRIVFDAASRQNGKLFLAEVLLGRPILLLLITSILLRFRCYSTVVVEDTKKASLNIDLQTPDYILLRVISNSFILTKVINTHLKRYPSSLTEELIRNTYADNILLYANSANKVEEKA
ncbi:unnamed protein product [Enterobius vermicularis]|uniref:Prohibitin n=1 Tax=Enterobius vermicularis TaxID=51028 RepID=A0A0N4VFN3_ENTVE|nr:unnamed protein product [Enterobius vermicularis]